MQCQICFICFLHYRDGAYGEPLVDLASHSNSLIWIVTPAILKKQWIWKSAYAILFNIHKVYLNDPVVDRQLPVWEIILIVNI